MNVSLLVPVIGRIPSRGLDQRLRHVEVAASNIYNLRYGNKSLNLFLMTALKQVSRFIALVTIKAHHSFEKSD